ncbi:hypothetical protein DEJ28_07950 [Curtobacterium sp. MCPF17_002]|uniref:hypothetical protein n=1 Tax=Curtobacterium sp. MCPF17_002 TaxID=2175645 RepID=UPI0011B3B993|nr:hypothetical protein [Curtobacterium sp. MCPF17_002]WIB79020.1 hypothetical protein DEJ28_07950 [Curtobacterium sp. MCPF17_002]
MTTRKAMPGARQNRYAPRTRAGLLLSCAGFAVLAASTALPAIEALVGPVMGLGFVVALLVIVSVPRAIRPGRTWLTAPLPARLAAATFAGVGIVGVASVTAGTSSGAGVWGVVGAVTITVGAALVACVPGERSPVDQEPPRCVQQQPPVTKQ